MTLHFFFNIYLLEVQLNELGTKTTLKTLLICEDKSTKFNFKVHLGTLQISEWKVYMHNKQIIQIQRFPEREREAERNIQESSSYSSPSSSVIVSNTGEMGTLVMEIMRRAGATSIQEVKYLISFAIAANNPIEQYSDWDGLETLTMTTMMKREWVSGFLPQLQQRDL